MKTSIRNSIIRLVILSSMLACQEEPVVKDTTIDNTATYGDFDIVLNNINALVPHGLGLSSLLSPKFFSSQPLKVSSAERNFEAWQEKLEITLSTSSLEECNQAMPEGVWTVDPLDHITCFGPELSYKDHPEFATNGVIPKNKVGMWWEFADVNAVKGKSCSAAVMNRLNEPSNYIGQSAIGLVAWGSCAARIHRHPLPKAGTSIDFLESIDPTSWQEQGFTINIFQISASDEAPADQAIFTIVIEGLMSLDGNAVPFSTLMKHRLKDEKFQSYSGYIQTVINLDDNTHVAYSLVYQLEDEVYRTVSRQIIDDTNSGNYFSDQTKLIDNSFYDKQFRWIEISSQWTPDLNHRQTILWKDHFNMILNGNTDSEGNGSVYFGYSDSNPDADTYGKIEGMACFPDETNGFQLLPKTQRQLLQSNSTSGLWEVNTSDIVFVPTNSCDVSYVIAFPGSKNHYTKIVNGPISNNLFDIETYNKQWLSPSHPTY